MIHHEPQTVWVAIDKDNPSIERIESRCVGCRLYAKVCSETIGVHSAYSLEKTGGRSVCIHCGQCVAVCPTDALVIRSSIDRFRAACADPETIVIASTSPAVRVALGARFVLDTNFAADLTILEEASELVGRLTKKNSATAAVHELLSRVGAVLRNIPSGKLAAPFVGQKPDRHAGRHGEDLFCAREEARSPKNRACRHHALHHEEGGD